MFLNKYPLWSLWALLLISTTSVGQCDGPFKGQQLSKQKIVQLLSKQHSKAKPLNLCGSHLSGIDLSGLDLSYVNLSGSDLSSTKFVNSNLSHANLTKAYFRWSNLEAANLFNANLSHANFENAHLNKADLRQSNAQHANFSRAQMGYSLLSGANFTNASFLNAKMEHVDLNWATLTQANLQGAVLENAELQHTKLIKADLSGAVLENTDFSFANLQQAKIINTNLLNANFFRANFLNVLYQPQLGKLPNVLMLVSSINFHTMNFKPQLGGPALAQLRAEYKRLGLRTMERTITAMLKIKQMQMAWQRGGWGYFESTINYLLFYITCGYGASPGQPLLIFLGLMVIFIFPYISSIRNPNRHNGITISWAGKRFYQWNRGSQDTDNKRIYCMVKTRNWRLALQYATFFSLLASFQIGWRELNVGNWITRIQPREYCLTPKGWVRTIAGTQSLLSAYLIVLWVLTYFGRPFEW